MASGFAVAAFFSISGFIIVAASLDHQGRPRLLRGEFLRRRFVRVIPFLWVCVIGYNLLSWAGTGTMAWSDAARTLVLSPVGDLKPNVAWSLRHELLFYLFFAVAAFGSVQRPKIILGWLATSVVFYLLAYDVGLASGVLEQRWFQALKVLMGGDHGANFQFAIGLGLGCLYVLKPHSLPLGRIPVASMLFFLTIGGFAVTYGPQAFGLINAAMWAVLVVPILACAVCASPLKGTLGAFGLVLGNASFSIYLLHSPVILIILALARKTHLPLASETHLAIFVILTAIAAIAGGIVAHYFLEAPLIRFCERLTRPRRQAPAPILVG